MEQFTRSGLTFPVRDSGPAGGAVVVLLHGFPQDASAYDHVTPKLTVAGLRTLVPTQRGYAPTNRPTGRRSYVTSELVGDVLALADAAGADRIHLVGHDFGGAVAWAMAAWHPQCVASLTVLSTPHPAALRGSLVRSGQLLRSWYVAPFQVPVVPELVLDRVLASMLRSSGLPAAVARRYSRGPKERLSGGLNWYRALPFSTRPSVGRIGVPTTLVWGRSDPFLGRVAAEATARFVDAEYRFLPLHADHWLPEKYSSAVSEAIVQRVGTGQARS